MNLWLKLLIGFFAILAVAKFVDQRSEIESGSSDSASTGGSATGTWGNGSASKEIDLGRLLGETRSEVEKALGLPVQIREVGGFRFYVYQWGEVSYTNDRFDYVDYDYKTRPSNIREALLKVGLDSSATEMREGKSPASGEVVTFFWRDDDGPAFECCRGIRIRNLLINSDFSRISITM
jgi:hypothetical protein